MHLRTQTQIKLQSEQEMLCLPRSWQWLKVAITTLTFLSIKPHAHLALFNYYWWIQLLNMPPWLFSSITGIYNYRTVLAPWCQPVPVNPAPPSSDSEAATNPELISSPLSPPLSPSSSPSPQVWTLQKIRFFLPHSHGVAFHGYGVSSFFTSSQYI